MKECDKGIRKAVSSMMLSISDRRRIWWLNTMILVDIFFIVTKESGEIRICQSIRAINQGIHRMTFQHKDMLLRMETALWTASRLYIDRRNGCMEEEKGEYRWIEGERWTDRIVFHDISLIYGYYLLYAKYCFTIKTKKMM